MKKKRIKLNVILLKAGLDFGKPESFIADYNSNQVLNMNKGDLPALLYQKLGSNKQPDWVKTFETKIGGLDLTQEMPKNKSSGVSLFIKVEDRIFVINWGMLARYNIAPNCTDRKFGIYTANKMLGSGESVKIKRAQSRVNESNPVNKQKQFGADITNNELFLSMEDNEALKELTIYDDASPDFYRLIGKYNSLNVQFVFTENELPCLQHLPSKLSKLLAVYMSVEKEDVKRLFKGLYPLEEAEAAQLFTELVNRLQNSPDDFFLFEPEIDFDFSAVSKFKLALRADEVLSDEFLLTDYLTRNASPSVDDLNEHEVHILDEDDKPIKSWSIVECLYGEIEFNNSNYILSHGEWFEVTKDKYKRITKKINEISDENFSVPDEVKSTTRQNIQDFKTQNPNAKKVDKERFFNTALSVHLGGLLFDEINKQVKLYEDRFEVCDILDPGQKKFIHVKNNDGASALSHLFNQGFISASSYAKFTKEYADIVNSKIDDDSKHISTQDSKAKIHFLIINDKTVNRLTFFSKMVLEDRITTLEAMGFSVTLSWVNGVYKDD